MILVFLMMLSCVRDDFQENSSPQQQDPGTHVRKVPFSELKANPKAMEQLKGFISQEATEGGINRRTVYSTEYKVVVDTANVWYIQKDGGGHSYTFEAFDLEGRYGREGDLKNVVLNYESRDGSYSKYVVSYNITEDDLFKWERGSGSINFPESTTFFNVGTSENPSGFTLNDPDCWETIIVAEPHACASGQHMPGQEDECQLVRIGRGPVEAITINVITVDCGDSGGANPGGPGNGSGPGSGGTNPGNGNNNGNNNGGNNNPGDDNPGHNNPGFYDKDGDPIITKPVKTLEPEEEEPEDEICKELNKILNLPNVKTSLNDLWSKINGHSEKAYTFCRWGNGVAAKPQKNSTGRSAQLHVLSTSFGNAHIHQIGTSATPVDKKLYQMFSIADVVTVRTFVNLHQGIDPIPHPYQPKLFFNMLLASDGYLYTVFPNNNEEFNNLDIFNNKKKLKDLEDKLYDLYVERGQNPDNVSPLGLAEDFLRFMGNINGSSGTNFNVSLYRVSMQNNFSGNWEKLELDPDDYNTLKEEPTPCN